MSPVGNSARAMLVYILPILIFLNILLLVYWIIRRKWLFALVPIITIACCIPYIGTIYQFRFGNGEKTQGGLKIATYNVAMFNRETSGFMAQDILAEMRRQKVDILCLQEYNEISGDKKNSNSYKEYFPYMAVGREDMVIYSRYPITGKKTILFEDTNNSAMWADIEIKGNTYRVYNAHLETTGINGTLHRAAKAQMRGSDIKSNAVLDALYGNYAVGMIARSGQANMLAMDMRESELPIIVCGDFNDVPYSYVYNTMLGDKVDGFKECGNGWMSTFRGNKQVRIDYIFHDPVLEGLTYYKKELSYSDHYPVFMKVTPKKQEE